MERDDSRGDINEEMLMGMVVFYFLSIVGGIGYLFFTLSISSFVLYGILQFIIWPLFGFGRGKGLARSLGLRHELVGTGRSRDGRMVSLKPSGRCAYSIGQHNH